MDLLDLLKAQVFYIYKLIENVIIYKYKILMLVIFKIIMQHLKGFNKCQNYIIKSLILSFCKKYLLRKKNFWVLFINFELKKL